MKNRALLTLIAGCLFALPASAEKREQIKPSGEIQVFSISESSGIVKSRQYENVFWTLNDSGDSARIFAITLDGDGIQTDWAIEREHPYQGIEVGEATNIDWEDIAIDDQGNLIIAACGNNNNSRRDLSVYVVSEPDPKLVYKTRIQRRIDFHFPDQTRFPDPKNKNFDCESMFFANGKLYFVSKNRSSGPAKLYRMDAKEIGTSNALTLVGTHELRGQATGADTTPDGKRLAVLTYAGCWVFDAPEGSDDYFSGKAYFKPFSAKQCEAICWLDEKTLLITNEQGDMYQLAVAEIPEVTAN